VPKKPSSIDMAFTFAEAEFGRKPKNKKSKIPVSLFSARKEAIKERAPEWTEDEDAFLRENIGKLTDEEIGKKIGRSMYAVRLRRMRDLHLPSPSKQAGVITANQAAALIGIDAHKLTYWCDAGMIPYSIMAGGRKIRLIPKVSFYRWVVSPSSWIYFDWKKIPDPHLYRLCQLRAQRWGDEWWTTSQVAKFYGKDLTAQDIKPLIKRKDIPAVQLQYSRGGRHTSRTWSLWFIKKSDAIQYSYKFKCGRQRWQPTERAIAWIRKAHKMGLTVLEITRSMGNPIGDDTLRKFMIQNLGLKFGLKP